MESIFASKLYKASNRKERINAALIAPSNLSLVQQLADDLDEEYQVPENLGQDDKKEDTKSTDSISMDEFKVDEEIDPEKDLVTIDDIGKRSGNTPSSKGGSASKHFSSDKGGSNDEPSKDADSSKSDLDNSNLMPESPGNDTSKPEPTEASTKITASIIADLEILKGTLNSRQDTSGVTRVAEKDNELWIYYNDDINLNNIMTDVIEYMMNQGYESFEFNRLARSDNAIVFVVTHSTTPNVDIENSDSSVKEVTEDLNLEIAE